MGLRAKMFSSVRARLTLWYTGVLALVLISFALAGYISLSYTLSRRTDDALGEMASAIAATLANDEADSRQGEANAASSEDAKNTPDEAIKEAVSQNQFRDYQLVVYTDARREVARSAVPQKRNEPDRTRPPSASKIAGVLDAIARISPTPNAALYFTSLSEGDNQ